MARAPTAARLDAATQAVPRRLPEAVPCASELVVAPADESPAAAATVARPALRRSADLRCGDAGSAARVVPLVSAAAVGLRTATKASRPAASRRLQPARRRLSLTRPGPSAQARERRPRPASPAARRPAAARRGRVRPATPPRHRRQQSPQRPAPEPGENSSRALAGEVQQPAWPARAPPCQAWPVSSRSPSRRTSVRPAARSAASSRGARRTASRRFLRLSSTRS